MPELIAKVTTYSIYETVAWLAVISKGKKKVNTLFNNKKRKNSCLCFYCLHRHKIQNNVHCSHDYFAETFTFSP